MATAEQYADWIVKNADKRGTPEFDTVARAYQFAKTAPIDDAITRGAKNFADDLPWHQQALAGIGKSIVDTGRGLGQIVGLVSRDDVAEARKLDAPLMQTGAGVTGNVAGDIGMMLLPGGALKGAGMAARTAGAADAAATMSKLGGMVLAPKTIVGAATVGVPMGLIQPSTSTRETMTNTAGTAVASAAAPVVGRAINAGIAAAEPLYKAGQEKIVGRLLNRVAGADAPQVAQRLSAAGEIVPGSAPTAGQAAGNAGVAALERTAAAVEPSATTAYAERMAAQDAARTGVLRDMSGQGGALDKATAKRDAMAAKLYGEARKQGVDPEAAKMLAPQIENLMGRMPAGVLDKAKELARINGEVMDKTGSINGLHWIKTAVDDILSAPKQNGIGKQTERAISQFKDDLLSVMDELSPAYKKARETFAKMSAPINQMQVAGEIADKSVNKLTGKLQPAAFARSLSDDTAARATGFNKATLEGTLSKPQLAKLQAIKEDAARAVEAQNAGRGVGSDTVQKLAYSNFIDAAGIPTFLRSLAPAEVVGGLAARGADALYGRSNKEMASRLAQLMLDPKESSRVMRLASSDAGKERLLQLLSRGGSAAGLAASPVLLNAQK